MTTGDRDLIRGFLAGNSASVQTIDRWIAAAVRSFRVRIGNGWDDLLQDIRVETIHRFQAAEFRGKAELKTYVWRIAVHAAISRVRRDAIRDHGPLEGIPAPLDPGMSALEKVLHTEEGLLALRIFDEAAGPCRDLWRQILDGRSYAEMSEKMGVSAGTLRVRVRRCRQLAVQLRERLLAASVEASRSKGDF